MINIEIPGSKTLTIEHIVLDYNGTLALDGSIIEGVEALLNNLSAKLSVYVVTADTFGKAAANLENVNCKLTILTKENQQQQKAAFIQELGKEHVVAIGNGCNDALMLAEAALGIVVVQGEGAAVKTLSHADVVVNNITDALGLFTNIKRLQATLRM